MNELHITADPSAEGIFESFFSGSEESGRQFYVFKDYLNEGYLRNDIAINFDQVRAGYLAQSYGLTDKQLSELQTLEKDLLQFSTQLSNGKVFDVIFWMGHNELDVTGYYLVLHYLKKHYERIHVINISGLPFLDKNGKLFFPRRVSELDVKEMQKSLSLKRQITTTEYELDRDEWKTLKETNAPLRILSGNKKVSSVGWEHLDEALHESYSPASRIARNTSVINEKLNAFFSERLISRRASELGLTKKEKSKDDGSDNQQSLDF